MKIILDNISKSYGSNIVIKNFTFSFEKKSYAILGKNGAGKSTLLKIIGNILLPSSGNIDYNIDPKLAVKQIKIPIQGGLNPNILLSDKINLKKNALNYLNIFKNHPYIFNLGHGILPKTNPMMIDYLVKLVEDY